MKLTIEINSVAELYELGDILKKLPELHSVSTALGSLDLDIRAYNCLKSEGIDTVEKLLKYSFYDLLKTPNLGRKSMIVIRAALALHGLKLRGD